MKNKKSLLWIEKSARGSLHKAKKRLGGGYAELYEHAILEKFVADHRA